MVPAGRLAKILAFWSLVGLAAHLAGDGDGIWQILCLPLALWILADLRASRRIPSLEVVRTHAGAWTQGRRGAVGIRIRHPGGRPLSGEIFDHHPPGWEMDGLPVRLGLGPGEEAVFEYHLRPVDRGTAVFHPPEILVDSPSRLWRARIRPGQTESVQVFPDLGILRSRDLGGRVALAGPGALLRRLRGEGTEFHQLREYRQGDSLRSIDWKATARQGRPVSREYREERDQQVVVLLDAGRRMASRDGSQSHFDHCLQAVLRLSWTAARQGDSVGLLCFSDKLRTWVAPGKGRLAQDRILAAAHDLQPDDAPPDFLMAAESLRARVRRRALVVLVTSLEEEDASTLHQALSLIGSRHLVLCASLREAALDRTLDHPPRDFADARTQAAVVQLLQRRHEAIARLGIPSRLLLESSPRSLHQDLAQRYLGIKQSGRL